MSDTPVNKRYLVYLASNHQGLELERYELQKIMAQQGMVNIGLVYRQDASPYDWALVSNQIETADLFILLLGDDYGPILPTGIGYLHREYVHAKSLNKPILAFLKNTVTDANLSENNRRLANLHRIVIQQAAYKLWHLRDELLTQARVALSSAVLSIGEGWVPADSVTRVNLPPVAGADKKEFTPRQKQTALKQMLNLQVSAKVYQGGNLSLDDIYVPARFDVLLQQITPLLKQGASEDKLRMNIESSLTDHVKKELLAKHTQAHAVDDVRVSRRQFQQMLQFWLELGLIAQRKGGTRVHWYAL